MRTKGRGAPDAEHPWNEIVPGLWMGGHRYTGPSGERTPAIVADEFDVVISMHQKDGHGPSDHVEHHYEDLPDGPLTAEQLEIVSRLMVNLDLLPFAAVLIGLGLLCADGQALEGRAPAAVARKVRL
ncbi:hypothetical protein [Actinomadura sp. BRA 177]|uniref:hypothetical protein n=1 Tax=Actinomadura sp. BRA 177 TaxID=2745202 RepID=UPI001594FA48|nr:hypothetical protein [Actinomadura sp. BRA 177]NVI85908.1 hypothetical protein [Actinomadura sp. BRA 177]